MSLQFRHVSELWVKMWDGLVNPPRGVPLPWWPRLNEMLYGLRPHELTLLCAPTGSGKTQFLANISAQLFEQEVPHFAAPVETGDEDFLARMLGTLEMRELNNGEPQRVELGERLTEKYLEKLKRSPIYISTYDNRVAIEEMITVLDYMHQEHKVQVAILDNLNFFLQPTSANDQLLEMDNAVHEFVMFCKRVPMHVILVVHPRKTTDGRVESEFDIKGSSTAVQECANVCLFNRPSKEQRDGESKILTDREMVFRKIRKRGKFVGRPIWFDFDNGRYFEQGSHENHTGPTGDSGSLRPRSGGVLRESTR